MTILVYGEKASRTHENQMLHVFLERLKDRWADSTDWIVAVADAMWNGAEMDLVCILPSAIIVADFKSYGGILTGTENGPWQADGVIAKGGRKANPYPVRIHPAWWQTTAERLCGTVQQNRPL